MAKVTVIPSTINPLTRLPNSELTKGEWQDMLGCQRIQMNSLRTMKHKWIIILSLLNQNQTGTLLKFILMKESVEQTLKKT